MYDDPSPSIILSAKCERLKRTLGCLFWVTPRRPSVSLSMKHGKLPLPSSRLSAASSRDACPFAQICHFGELSKILYQVLSLSILNIPSTISLQFGNIVPRWRTSHESLIYSVGPPALINLVPIHSLLPFDQLSVFVCRDFHSFHNA